MCVAYISEINNFILTDGKKTSKGGRTEEGKFTFCPKIKKLFQTEGKNIQNDYALIDKINLYYKSSKTLKTLSSWDSL